MSIKINTHFESLVMTGVLKFSLLPPRWTTRISPCSTMFLLDWTFTPERYNFRVLGCCTGNALPPVGSEVLLRQDNPNIPATNMDEFHLLGIFSFWRDFEKYIYLKTGHTLTITPKYTITRFICHNKCLYFAINLMLLENFIYTQQDSPNPSNASHYFW